jgi:hypothetical protein
MKALSTEKQEELLELVLQLVEYGSTPGQLLPSNYLHDLQYWAIELKPKRVRRNKIDKSNQKVVE